MEYCQSRALVLIFSLLDRARFTVPRKMKKEIMPMYQFLNVWLRSATGWAGMKWVTMVNTPMTKIMARGILSLISPSYPIASHCSSASMPRSFKTTPTIIMKIKMTLAMSWPLMLPI